MTDNPAETMLTRMAMAMCDKVEGEDVWYDLSASDQESYRDLAKAALEAIREPSEGVSSAATRILFPIHPAPAFTAMIDAILDGRA